MEHESSCLADTRKIIYLSPGPLPRVQGYLISTQLMPFLDDPKAKQRVYGQTTLW